MINFSFNLSWPWFKPIKAKFGQIDYIVKEWRITKNKSLEIQFSKAGKTLIGAGFRWDMRCDHAGVSLDIALFRRFFNVHFYDGRHWNYDKNRYINYDDPDEVRGGHED